MRKGLILGMVLIFFISGIALAGSAKLTGSWSGTAKSIVCCPDPDPAEPPTCSTVEIGATAILVQNGNLLYGSFIADDYTHPCWGPIVGQEAVLTGTISSYKTISGIVGIPGDMANIQGIGVFEGKWSGNKMKAVLRDFSDGSTTIGTFYKD